MRRLTTRIIAFILLTSHMLMSCNNWQAELPSQPHDHGERTKQHDSADLVIHQGSPSPATIQVALPIVGTQASVLLKNRPKFDLTNPKTSTLQAKNKKRTSIPNQHTTTLLQHNVLQQAQRKEHTKRTKRKKGIRRSAHAKGNNTVSTKQPIVGIVPNNYHQTSYVGSQALTLRPLPSSMMQAHCTQGYAMPDLSACIQATSLVPTIRTQEGHQVSLIQDTGYWWGIVKRNNTAPACSPTLTLPVLYPRGIHVTTLGGQIQHTIEALLNCPTALQRYMLRVVLPEQSPHKQGFVYTGPGMELVGGGFWGSFFSTVATVVVGATVGAGIGFLLGGFWGAVVGGIIGGLAASIDCVMTCIARKKSRIRLEGQTNEAYRVCNHNINKAAAKIKEVDKEININPHAYKKIHDFLRPILDCRKEIDSQIEELKDWRKKATEENWFFSFGVAIKDMIHLRLRFGNSLGGLDPTEDILWDEDFVYLEEQIASREADLDTIDRQIQEVKEKCRKQAWEAFEDAAKVADNRNTECSQNLDDAMASAMTSGVDGLKKSFSAIQNQILDNIEMYKGWKNVQALSEEDQRKIDKCIDKEKAKLESKKMKLTEKLIEFSKKDNNNLKILAQILNTQAGTNDLITKNHCSLAIKNGETCIIEYLLEYKNMSPDLPNKLGNTLLHQAISTNQPEIVKLLLEKHADRLAKNRYGKTPLDLASDKPEIKKIFEEIL